MNFASSVLTAVSDVNATAGKIDFAASWGFDSNFKCNTCNDGMAYIHDDLLGSQAAKDWV